MMDITKIFDNNLIQQINGLKERSNYKSLLYVLYDWLVIFSCIFVTVKFSSVWVYLMSIVLIGSRMRALENLVHEGSHGHLSKNSFINSFICMLFCAFPLGHSLSVYRVSHMEHHRYLGNEKSDPDLVRYRELGIDKLPSTKKFLLTHLAKIFFLVGMPKYFIGTIRAFIYSKNASKSELLIRCIFYGSLALIFTKLEIWKYFFLFWVIPFSTSFQIIRQLSEISEHGGLYQNVDKLQMSRNNFCHPILRFLLYPHNDFCHLVHHMFPNIPGFNLFKAHEVLMQNKEYKNAHHCYSLKSAFGEMVAS